MSEFMTGFLVCYAVLVVPCLGLCYVNHCLSSVVNKLMEEALRNDEKEPTNE